MVTAPSFRRCVDRGALPDGRPHRALAAGDPLLRSLDPDRGGHLGVPAAGSSLPLWIVLAAVSIAPLPAVLARQTHRAERREAARQIIAHQAREQSEQRRNETLARFQQLHAGSPLWAWMEFAAKDHELREQALEAMRRLPHRQADAEAMLRRGLPFPLLELPHLNLAPTAELCAAATAFLIAHAQSMLPTVPDPPPFHLLAYRFEPFLAGLAWLHAHNCPCGEAVQALQNSASAYPASRERDAFLAALQRLR